MDTIVAVPLDSELASFIGKKGVDESIAFYNRKMGSDIIIGIAPSSMEEKFSALPETLLLADMILLSTKNVDKTFGEVLVASLLLNKRIMLTSDNDVSAMLLGISTANISVVERDSLLDTILKNATNANASGEPRVDIDKAFNVKGVGTVALGIVTKGRIKVHDNLLHSSGKTVSIRSIQAQDEDQKEAGVGVRVGLALKNIDADDIEKGDILSSKAVKRVKNIVVDIETSSFVKEELEVNKRYSIASNFSYSDAFVDSIEGKTVKLRLEKAIAIDTNDRCLLVRGSVPRIFASGTVKEAAV
ncbi:MAG: hypothetical protein KGH60_03970 [Candidatus Micrarchaeota archaeon]|nr:hypothetical protein [Candidatus Micrarchaeota archaeon]